MGTPDLGYNRARAGYNILNMQKLIKFQTDLRIPTTEDTNFYSPFPVEIYQNGYCNLVKLNFWFSIFGLAVTMATSHPNNRQIYSSFWPKLSVIYTLLLKSHSYFATSWK